MGKGEIMDYKELLKSEMMPAFGCTEPIALAYASAKAREVLGEIPDRINILCSGNMIKNAKSVIVPGAGGRKGIEISCVLGILAGNPGRELEVLIETRKEDIAEAEKMIQEGYCNIVLVPDVENLYIRIEAFKGTGSSVIVVQGKHTNITYMEKNGEVLLQKGEEFKELTLEEFSFAKIYDFACNCDYEDIKPLLDMQIEYNRAIAEEGIANSYGSNIGKLILETSDSIEEKARAYAAAGSDARMSGCEMPVVINSGSGNQGITISVPIVIYAEHFKRSADKLYRSLIFANLVGLYQKKGIGRLSAYCGVVSAASASVAGIAFLNDEPRKVIEETLINSLAGNSGILCDGAKPSCAMKIASSVGNAFLAYRQARSDNSFCSGDGIVKDSVDETIETVGHIAKYGMKRTDEVILGEMIDKRE